MKTGVGRLGMDLPECCLQLNLQIFIYYWNQAVPQIKSTHSLTQDSYRPHLMLESMNLWMW